MSRIFDIPCYWPILLGYFVFLFVLMMQKRILHMWKHKYLPFSWGKKHYNKGNGYKKTDSHGTSAGSSTSVDGMSTFRKLPPGFLDSSNLSPTPFSYEDGTSFNDMGMTSTLNENTFGRITTPMTTSSGIAHSSSIALEPIQIPATMKKVK